METVKKGNISQFSLIGIIRTKIMGYSVGFTELINEIVYNKDLVFRTSDGRRIYRTRAVTICEPPRLLTISTRTTRI
jgi:hypothetical protein